MTTQAREETLRIATAEGVSFAYDLAGPVSRMLAWLTDAAAIVLTVSVLQSVVALLGWISWDIALFVFYIANFAVSIGYGIAFEYAWRGQTPGKRLLRLRVMDASGARLQLEQVVIRNLLRFVDSLPALYFLGGTACLLSRHSQRLGDIAAGTVVIRIPRWEPPDTSALPAVKYNSFRNHPHLEARLRQRIGPAEASAAVRALTRRTQLDPAARIHLFAEIADVFRQAAPFPAETTEGLTDEQYVMNCVDSIYRHGRGSTAGRTSDG